MNKQYIVHIRSLIIYVFCVVLNIGFSVPVSAEPGGFEGKEPGYDFSDYSPVYEEEDVYEDESYMYFGKSFGVSLGTGMQVWTGSASRIFDSAFPVFDGGLLFLGDHWVTEVGIGFARHGGYSETFGDIILKNFRLSIGGRYYFNVGTAREGTRAVAPYLGLAFRYESLTFEFNTLNQTTAINLVDWNAPIVGKLPFPIWPTLAAGVDFSLKPGSSVLNFEARWQPLGSFFGEQPVLEQLFGEKRLGDTFMFATHVTFIFD